MIFRSALLSPIFNNVLAILIMALLSPIFNSVLAILRMALLSPIFNSVQGRGNLEKCVTLAHF